MKTKHRLLFIPFVCACTVSQAQIPTLAKSWTGLYNDEQKISLFINQNGADVTGYSLLNGKATNFKGKIAKTDLNYTIVLNEIGQGANIGKFLLQFNPNMPNLEASWASSSQSVKPKFFTLNSQQCKFAKGQGEFPYTSTRLLKDADLQVPLSELQYMRNEIYARHGFAFANKEWASTFSRSSWYMPCYTDVNKFLTSIEKQNISRIKAVEPYASNADWGR